MIYGNVFLSEEYIVEYTGANKEYIQLLKDLKRNFNTEKKKYSECFRKHDKQGCLDCLDKMDKLVAETAYIDINKIAPDKDDTILSLLAGVIQSTIVGAVPGIAAGAATFAAIGKIFTAAFAALGIVYKVMPDDTNPVSRVDDFSNRWNLFRNQWAKYFKQYTIYLIKQRKIVESW